jgi:hypothetical protein
MKQFGVVAVFFYLNICSVSGLLVHLDEYEGQQCHDRLFTKLVDMGSVELMSVPWMFY